VVAPKTHQAPGKKKKKRLYAPVIRKYFGLIGEGSEKKAAPKIEKRGKGEDKTPVTANQLPSTPKTTPGTGGESGKRPGRKD